MIPGGQLSDPAVPGEFLSPRNRTRDYLIDYERGGSGIRDTCAGLDVQDWWVTVDPGTDAVILQAENVEPFEVLVVPGITEVALAFDSAMNPFLAWVAAGTVYFRWWDPVTLDFVVSTLPAGSYNPRATLDERRPLQGDGADIILTYMRGGGLYYRQLRDRFADEYLLRSGLDGVLLGQFGMSSLGRLQWEMHTDGDVPPTPPPTPDTILAVLDTPDFTGGDDDAAGLGVYVAAATDDPDTWPGCEVEISRDGGTSWSLVATLTNPSVMGVTLTDLADHPAEWPDLVHAVRVELFNDSRTLTTTDLAGICNGVNAAMIGGEQLRFAVADVEGGETYELSTMLRGRNGTDTEAHGIGERFVLLERPRVVFVPLLEADLGQELRFRARTLGASSVSNTETLAAFAGRTQVERAPMITGARREGDDVVVQWLGVGRVDFGAFVSHGVFFDGYRVTIDDGDMPPVVIDTPDLEVVADAYGFGSPLTIHVQQRNTLTGLGPPAEVVIP